MLLAPYRVSYYKEREEGREREGGGEGGRSLEMWKEARAGSWRAKYAKFDMDMRIRGPFALLAPFRSCKSFATDRIFSETEPRTNIKNVSSQVGFFCLKTLMAVRKELSRKELDAGE